MPFELCVTSSLLFVMLQGPRIILSSLRDVLETLKDIFSVVNTLCKERQDNPLPPHEHLHQSANEFGEFFC